MAQFPPLPARKEMPDGLWIVLDRIIAFCKSLRVRGDGKTTQVNYTDGGYTVSNGMRTKEVYFLEVTEIDGDGCPATSEWHKYTIPYLSDTVEDPPTV